jgi:hypothetical protein
VFADLDGAPLEPAMDFKLKPQIVVESSKGRYHCIWLVDHEKFPLALPLFEVVQSRIAELFHSDKTVKDLPRVLRLPGFYHKKKEPFLVNLVSTHNTPERYPAEQILEAFGLSPKTGKPHKMPIAIPQGQRDTRLMSFAGSMRRAGASEPSILSALTIENQRCVPPLEESELIRIAHSVSKYTPVEGDFVRDVATGKIYPNNQQNIKIALEKLNVQVSYDLFSERYIVTRTGEEPEHMEDKIVDRLWLEADRCLADKSSCLIQKLAVNFRAREPRCASFDEESSDPVLRSRPHHYLLTVVTVKAVSTDSLTE